METYVGSIWAVGFDFAPKGFFSCQGQLLPPNQYAALFSLLGTTYGGNGQTTFALPDLRGRVNQGFGQLPGSGSAGYVMGQNAGTVDIGLSVNQLPVHGHTATFALIKSPSTPITLTVNVVNGTGNQVSPLNNYVAGGHGLAASVATFVPSGTTTPMANGSITVTGATGITGGTIAVSPNGGSSAMSIMQPYVAVNYIICNTGIYPTRN